MDDTGCPVRMNEVDEACEPRSGDSSLTVSGGESSTGGAVCGGCCGRGGSGSAGNFGALGTSTT